MRPKCYRSISCSVSRKIRMKGSVFYSAEAPTVSTLLFGQPSISGLLLSFLIFASGLIPCYLLNSLRNIRLLHKYVKSVSYSTVFPRQSWSLQDRPQRTRRSGRVCNIGEAKRSTSCRYKQPYSEIFLKVAKKSNRTDRYPTRRLERLAIAVPTWCSESWSCDQQ